MKTLDEGKCAASCATSARIFVLRVTVFGEETKKPPPGSRLVTAFKFWHPERNGQPEDGGHHAFVTASS
jgi:hypothetical protein